MRTSPKVWLVAALLAALTLSLLVGCGGGGGGGGGGTGPSPVSISLSTTAPNNDLAYGASATITATVQNSTDKTVVFSISPSFSGFKQENSSTAIFTANSATGVYTITARADADQSVTSTVTITVVPVTITISPKSVTVPPSGVVQFTGSVAGSSNTAVSFSSPSGTFQAVAGNSAATNYTAPAIPGTYVVTASAVAEPAAKTTAVVTVSSTGLTTATVTGTVKDDQNQPLPGIVIQFFNTGGTEVGQATTSSTGTFSASTPISAVSFGISSSSINRNNDFEEYLYNSIYYDPLIAGCYAPLPALTSGGSVSLTNIQVASNVGPPPPPPNGCQ